MSWDELEKRRTADIVSRRFGVSAKETVFVRDGYELTRHLLQCARQGRSRAAAIYPADAQETINQAVGDSLNGTRPLLLNQSGGWFHLDVTDAVTSRDPLRFWGVTALTDRSLEPGLTMPGALRCPCPPDFIRQHLRKGTML